MNSLRKVSGAGWDEDNCIITLDATHYAGHIKDHKADAEYFNKPLEHYMAMSTIFGSSMATGKYAKGSNEPVGVVDVENDEPATPNDANDVPATPNSIDANAVPSTPTEEQGASSSITRPKKRAKIADLEIDPLVRAFESASDKLSDAIKELTKGDMDLSSDLYTQLTSLSGFNSTHISFYYSHLVANPHIGRTFYNLPFEAKIDWFEEFITSKFPGN